MHTFFTTYSSFVRQIFSGKYLFVHAFAIASTALLVFSGLDWAYLVFVITTMPRSLLFVADGIGFLVPVLLPLILYGLWRLTKSDLYRRCSIASLYAVVLGFTLSMFIKMFTGRVSPPHRHRGEELVLIDNSHDFNFGFMETQIMGGWPSSHTTIAFALAVSLALIMPRWYTWMLFIAAASFVGIGVTFGFHWLSEFFAGACLGSVIGHVVGMRYRNSSQ